MNQSNIHHDLNLPQSVHLLVAELHRSSRVAADTVVYRGCTDSGEVIMLIGGKPRPDISLAEPEWLWGVLVSTPEKPMTWCTAQHRSIDEAVRSIDRESVRRARNGASERAALLSSDACGNQESAQSQTRFVLAREIVHSLTECGTTLARALNAAAAGHWAELAQSLPEPGYAKVLDVLDDLTRGLIGAFAAIAGAADTEQLQVRAESIVTLLCTIACETRELVREVDPTYHANTTTLVSTPEN
ncbi:hypothetical protein GCM10022247_34740 [Allokutzneria multivorans]|uniref:Uncharacterized protein n=1 Tax=Allokutzneria multivorans TaxID=1142134 RepID=A0ABP7SBQ4_9PSEU